MIPAILLTVLAFIGGSISALGTVARLQRAKYALRTSVKTWRLTLYVLSQSFALAMTVTAQIVGVLIPLWAALSLLPICGNAVSVLACRRFPRFTARPVRLWMVYLFGTLVAAALLAVFGRYYWMGFVATASPYGVRILACILTPLENAHNRRFVAHMHNKWRESGVVTIGITGSAGKTTVKRMLCAALGEGAYGTKGNYNTPMGLALAIRDMPPDTSYFVAEMGISHQGDMQRLLQVVTPSVGILTNVLPQHTATAGGVAEILAQKRLLLDASSRRFAPVELDLNGLAVHRVGEGGEYQAVGVRLGKEQTAFIIRSPLGDYPICLPLLGRGCVLDTVYAFAVATSLGVAPAIVAKRLSQIERVPHRMQLVLSSRGVTIIDDSYNLNVMGARYAMEYLLLYDGRKVVAVSGIAESDPHLALNRQLGEVVKKADVIFIVGDRYRKELCEGIGRTEGVYYARSTKESLKLYQTLLRKGDTLLIMADMPE